MRRFVKKRAKLTILVLAAVAFLGGAFLFVKNNKSFAETLENDVQVDENSDLSYYLHVKYDGIDRDGTISGDDTKINVVSGVIEVSDRIPEGLIFQSFETTPTGVIGSFLRGDETQACSGIVVDDTQEEAVDEGTWDANHENYYYHGLHYSTDANTVTFKVQGLQAGCQLDVGINTKTPTLPEGVYRMDFYNNANAIESTMDITSNTVHAYIQRQKTQLYKLVYSYDGDVPEGAPAAPATQQYAAGATVNVAKAPVVEGYDFNGWRIADRRGGGISSLTMPEEDVLLVGNFVEDESPYDVEYVIEGDAPASYRAPKTRSYFKNSPVSVDSMEADTEIDDYSFNGWESTDVDITSGEFDMPENNVTIRGSFDRAEYTVSYEYEGDVPANAPALPASATYHEGDAVTVADKPVVAGYDFYGWSLDDFTMEAYDVVIKGSFEAQPETFTLGVDMAITNPKEKFEKGDVVEFEITVTNPNDFDVTEVALRELLEGARFVEGDGYTVRSDSVAMIPELAAGGSIKVHAVFEVTENKDAHYDNTVAVVSAIAAGNNQFDGEGCEATIGFDTRKKPGEIIPDGTITPETLDKIGKYVLVIVICGVLAAICVLIHTKLPRKRAALIDRISLSVIAVAVLSCGVISVAKHASAARAYENTATYKSQKTNYDDKEAGAWKVDTEAILVDEETVRVKTTVMTTSNRISEKPRDVVIVYGDTCSVRKQGDIQSDVFAERSYFYNSIANYIIDDVLSLRDDNRVGVISYDDRSEVQSGALSRDADSLKSLVALDDSIMASTCVTQYFNQPRSKEASLAVVEDYLNGYEVEEGRDLYVVYLSEELHRQANQGNWSLNTYEGENDLRNQIAQNELEYTILKELYPNLTINTLAADESFRTGRSVYDVGRDHPSDEIIRLGDYREYASDNMYGYWRYWREQQSFLPDKISSIWWGAIDTYRLYDNNYIYETFDFKQTIDSRYFEFVRNDGYYYEGKAVVDESNPDVIDWQFGSLGRQNGRVAYAILKLKDGHPETDDYIYPLFTNTKITTEVIDANSGEYLTGETLATSKTPEIKTKYTVNYNYNLPEGCSLPDGFVDSEDINAYAVVEKPEQITCEGWINRPYNINSDSAVIERGDDYYVMPQDDVVVSAVKSKLDIEKSMDGTVHEATSAYLVSGTDFLRHVFAISTNSQTLPPNYNQSALFMESFQRADSLPSTVDTTNQVYIISTPESPVPVYMWGGTMHGCPIYDGTTKACKDFYYYSTADNIYLNPDSSYMFANIDTLRSVPGLSSLDASLVEDMSYFMQGSGMITDLTPLATWETPNLKNLKKAWYNVKNLENISGLEALDTTNVEDMSGIFGQDDKLSSLDPISGWSVANAKNLSEAFYQTTALTSTDALSGWRLSSLENFEGAFSESGIKNVDGLLNWAPSKIKNMKNAFADSAIEDVDGLINWTTPDLEDIGTAFRGTTNLKNVDGLANLTLTKITSLDSLFDNSGITNVDGLANWDVSNVTTMNSTFADDTSLQNLNGLAGWKDKVSRLQYLTNTFERDTALANINGLDEWQTPELKSMDHVFEQSGIASVQALDNWDVRKLETMRNAFYKTKSLANLNGLETWKTDSLTGYALYQTFAGSGISSVTGLSGWNVSGLTALPYTFTGSNNLTSLQGLGGWDVSHVESMLNTFAGDAVMVGSQVQYSKLSDISALSTWTVSSLKEMPWLFYQTPDLKDISALAGWRPVLQGSNALTRTFSVTGITNVDALSGWNIGNVTALDYTFAKSKLANLEGISEWNVANVGSMSGTFQDVVTLTSLEDLSKWNPLLSTNEALSYTFDGAGITSLKGIEKFRVWNVKKLLNTFANCASLTTLGYTENGVKYGLAGWANATGNIKTYTGVFRGDIALEDMTAMSDWTWNSSITKMYNLLSVPTTAAGYDIVNSHIGN